MLQGNKVKTVPNQSVSNMRVIYDFTRLTGDNITTLGIFANNLLTGNAPEISPTPV